MMGKTWMKIYPALLEPLTKSASKLLSSLLIIPPVGDTGIKRHLSPNGKLAACLVI